MFPEKKMVSLCICRAMGIPQLYMHDNFSLWMQKFPSSYWNPDVQLLFLILFVHLFLLLSVTLEYLSLILV